MDNFIVSARKYRPVTFESVVGQQHVTNTLKNAIRNNQLAQAFLFCGPRGVGKTTCARILAKTINCLNLQPSGEACGECDSCRAFQNGNSFNVHELDAASNNSVDDIRSLIEQVRIPPQAGKYKVYIIDEVHMLSQAAFNAFLKTLEEPPPYAIFILATTEKHKILPTILSRCQIFDFSRIKVDDMANHLASIAQKENISYEPDGLHIIAQKADGGLRDALSMFDQIVSFSGGNVTYRTVIDNLNILDYDYYFNITDSLLGENTAKTLLLFDEILSKGFDGSHFITGLSGHLRNLLVGKDQATLKLLEVSEGIRNKYLQQAQQSTASFLLSAINIANQCDLNYRLSKNQRLQVELALLKICHLQSALNLAASPLQAQATPSGEVKKKPEPVATAPVEAKPQPVTPVVEVKPVQAATISIPSLNGSTNPVYNGGTTPSLPKAAEPAVNYNAPTPATPEKAAPVAPVVPQTVNIPKISLMPSISTSIPSLNGGSYGSSLAVAEEEDPYEKGTDNESFTPEAFMEHWMKFAGKVKSENGSMTMFTILTANAPVMLRPYEYEVVVHNKTQETCLRDEKPALLNYLRRELRNYSIEVNARIQEQTQSKRPYTAIEKFQHMAAKNPNIMELRKRFNLELD